VKSRLGVLLVLAVLSFSASAQSDIKVQVGPGVYTLGFSGLYGARIGYSAGLAYSQPIFDGLAFEIGANYTLKGASLSNQLQAHLDYHYLDLPILGIYHLTPQTSLLGGAQPSFLINANRNVQGMLTDWNEGLRKIDIAAVIGVSHSLSSKFSVAVKSVIGVINSTNASAASEVKFQNYGVQASVGFKLISLHNE